MIVNSLGIKEYIRYMDDGVLFHYDKEYLKYSLKRIEEVVHKYKLELNEKTKIYLSYEQIEFIGFCFFIKNNRIIMKVNNKTKYEMTFSLTKTDGIWIMDNLTEIDRKKIHGLY